MSHGRSRSMIKRSYSNKGKIICNRPKRTKESDFVDIQVATLISDHDGDELCIEDLVTTAEKDMPRFQWTNDKIRNSINRLEKRGRLASKYAIRGGKLCRVPYQI